MTKQEMDDLTEGLPTKSAKIRVLAARGVSRSEIAKYLEIRYQHVRNVLIAPPPFKSGAGSVKTAKFDDAAKPLSIVEAKRGLAAQFGVPPNAIEITIRG